MFRFDDVVTELRAKAGAGDVVVSVRTALVLPPHGAPLRAIDGGPGDVTFIVGAGSRIRVVADDDHDERSFADVIDGVADGRLEEYYGSDEVDEIAPIGWSVTYAAGSRSGIDEGVTIIATHRWPAWKLSTAD